MPTAWSTSAYHAAAGRVVQIVPSEEDGRRFIYHLTDVAAGGPDLAVRYNEPLGPLADFVASLARSGDERVIEATHEVTGREIWRYDGPFAGDRLSGGPLPDRVVAEVDRETGTLLTMRTTVSGRAFQNLETTTVETSDTVDRSRFTIDGTPTSTFSRGFQRATLEEAADTVPYPVLVPEDVPAGFELDSVSVNRDVALGSGAEGMNPPVADVVSLRWRKGWLSFTVTLRPTDGQAWDDPFGQEGKKFASKPVRVEVPGMSPLEGVVVVDAGGPPHLWGITSDIVVTADGDISAEELVRLAGSLRR